MVFIDCFDEAWDVVDSPLIGDVDETIIILQLIRESTR